MIITEKNNIFYIRYYDEYFDWCDIDENTSTAPMWFPLNETTRHMFARDIIPLMKEGKVSISKDVYEKIKFFKQNEQEELFTFNETSSIPNGITLYDHQIKAINLMSKYKRYGFFYGTGTGKTLIAITWLMNVKPNSCLIVTPQKVVGQYKKELNLYIPGNNYDVTNFEQLSKYQDKIYDALIVDECHRAKNYSSNINKFLREISSKTTYCYIFTGSPMDKSRHEILPQLALLDNRVLSVKTRVFERYFRINDYFQPAGEIRERKAELTQLINAYTLGVKTESVIDLPDEINKTIDCIKPNEEYNTLFKSMVLNKEDYKYIADTPASLRLGLKSLCSGLLYMDKDDSEKNAVMFNTDKIARLKDLVTKLKNAIIYYEFTPSAKMIEEALTSLNRTSVTVNGSINAKKSFELIESFKNNKVDFLIIQSQSGNAGLDLTNTNNIIFYSLPDSYIVFHQCKSRIRRIGQSKDCNYFYLICVDSIEEKIYQTLAQKKTFNDRVFEQYKRSIL